MCSGSNNGLVLQTFNPPLWNKLHSKIPKGKGGRASGKQLFNECRSQSGVHKILYCGIFFLKKFATKETATHALLVEIECTLQSGCQFRANERF